MYASLLPVRNLFVALHVLLRRWSRDMRCCVAALSIIGLSLQSYLVFAVYDIMSSSSASGRAKSQSMGSSLFMNS